MRTNAPDEILITVPELHLDSVLGLELNARLLTPAASDRGSSGGNREDGASTAILAKRHVGPVVALDELLVLALVDDPVDAALGRGRHDAELRVWCGLDRELCAPVHTAIAPDAFVVHPALAELPVLVEEGDARLRWSLVNTWQS
jgi:hypothetical protein